MKKTLSAILTLILILSSLVFCASAQEVGIFRMFEGEDYTIVATMRYSIVHPRGGSSWQYYNYGVIDRNGNYIVPPTYSKINEPHDGRALYSVSNSDGSYYGYFDENWNVMEKMKYDSARDFSEGVAVVGANIGAPSPIAMTTRYGCVDRFGRTVVPIEYHQVKNAKDGRIKVELYEQIYPISNHRSRIGYYSTDGALLEAPVFRHPDKEYEAVTNVGNVRFGDTTVDNPSLKYPIVSVFGSDGGCYLPLTYENCKMLGIGISGNHLEGIKLWRETAEPCTDGLGKSVMPENGKTMMQKYGGAIIVDGVSYTNADAPIPMLYYKDVVYLPLYWVTLTGKLGLGYSYDLGTGIRISTDNHTETAPEAVLPTFNVTLNGTKLDSSHRQYPLIVYKDITYFPMTYFDCRFLGLTTKWDNDTRTLYIDKENIACAYRDYRQEKENERKFSPTVCDFNIVVNGKEINNKAEEYPLLIFRDVTYFPLTWRFAYEEFGWSYSFTPEKGLVINSDNYHPENVEIPDSAGFAAFDGEYYYYTATKDGKNVVCRASASDLNAGEIIFELPESPMTHGAAFINSFDGIYIEYATGWGATSYTEHYRKINSDGTLTEQIPDKDIYNKHGSTVITVRNEKITVEACSESFQKPFTIKYTVNGKETKAEIPKNLAIGVKINGKSLDSNRINRENLVKIHGDKIYFLAFEYGKENETSDIYVIDTNTGRTERLIENAEGAFHVYTGWDNEISEDSTMIIFGHSGNILRYSEKADKTVIVKETDNKDLILEGASGDYMIYTAQKSFYGDRTIVSRFDCYASGAGSINQTILDTATGTYITFTGGLMAIYTLGESADDSVRTAVVGMHNGNDVCLLTSDVCSGFFARNGYLTYRMSGNITTVKLR